MKKLSLYQIDAFAEQAFTGNPAAVVLLKEWLPDALMQQIAMENNLSETAFIVPMEDHFGIRFFTPVAEVALCGHATLASSYALFQLEGYQEKLLVFRTTHRGDLLISRKDDLYLLDFPADHVQSCDAPEGLIEAMSIAPIEIYSGTTDYLLVYPSEQDILKLSPNFERLKKVDARGIIVTAQGDSCDFVSRFFAPRLEINEDPVTGSAHTCLIPFWSQRIGKKEMKARQLSKRGGSLYCENRDTRVIIGGKAFHYLTGTIFV
ncbi:MAG: PhzF family phenazine biosynthesis protein [Prolixibacteraceae bacterium]|nr:PhzF family phenazine biosynthesis protein [Prolixibacteraceae bacterium]